MALICLRTVQHLKLEFRNGARYISTCSCRHSMDTEKIKPEGWDNALPYSSIPGPQPLPLIGNAWLFLPIVGLFYKSSISDFSDILYKKYGKIFRLGHLPGDDMVFICSPDDIEMVYRNEGIYPVRDIASKTIAYYRNVLRHDIFQGVSGTLTVQGKEWHDIRSKINPILMQPQTMLQYVSGIDLITDELLAKIRHFAKLNQNEEMPDDFMNTIYAWALESVAYIALDQRLGCLALNLDSSSETLKIIRAVLKSFDLYEKLEFRPSFRNIYKTKMWKEFVETADLLTYTFLKYIKEAESQIKETNEKSTSVLQRLLKIDRRIAITTSLDMLGAGVDTTGKQTASILYYLAKNQDAQNSLRNELCTLLPNKETPVTKEVIGQASYLKAVIKETERIAPISQGNLRQSVKDMVLSGYQIPKDTKIVTCNGIASKLNENYPQPLEFLPERWLRTTVGELSHKNTNPFVTLPFGFGPRSCVGRRLATLEMEIGIAKVMRNFQVMWNHKDATFDGTPFIGIVEPLKLQFIERES